MAFFPFFGSRSAYPVFSGRSQQSDGSSEPSFDDLCGSAVYDGVHILDKLELSCAGILRKQEAGEYAGVCFCNVAAISQKDVPVLGNVGITAFSYSDMPVAFAGDIQCQYISTL